MLFVAVLDPVHAGWQAGLPVQPIRAGIPEIAALNRIENTGLNGCARRQSAVLKYGGAAWLSA